MPSVSELSGYILFLPSASSVSVPYWQVEAGAIVASGDLHLGGGSPLWPGDGAAQTVLALIPTADATVSWSPIGALSPKQAQTAARIKVQQQTLSQGGELHIVSVTASSHENAAISPDDEPQILAALMSAQTLKTGLDILAAHGCDPDILLPAGLVITTPGSGFLRVTVGEEGFVRGPMLVIPNEPALVTAIIDESPITDLNAVQTDTALLAAFADPAINLRVGAFAKRRARSGITVQQWKILGALLLTGLLASLFLAVATWVKYDRAIAREDAAALAAIQKLVPGATDVTQGQMELNRALASRGAAAQMSPLAASAYTILQQFPSVTLRDLRYNGDGILAFTLAAPNVDGINQALLIMQQQGYRVTATPRQEASGLAMADISMRAQ
jgi:general secretion pathway protein L